MQINIEVNGNLEELKDWALNSFFNMLTLPSKGLQHALFETHSTNETLLLWVKGDGFILTEHRAAYSRRLAGIQICLFFSV